MADFGVIIVERLIEVIGSTLIKNICEKWNYKSELEELGRSVETIKNVLVDAESKRDLTKTEQAYIDELKAVVYDADDLFDEFHTLAELNQLDNKRNHDFLKKVRNFFSSKKNEASQAKNISNKVKEIKRKLDSAVENHKNINLKLDVKPNKQRRETSSHLTEMIVVGREDDKKRIIDMLLSPDIKEDVSFLSIAGAGGLGKTTLAKLVHNDQVIQKEFSTLRLWVCVSDQDGELFDVKDILCRILKLFPDYQQSYSTCPMEVVKNEFINKLGGKKYLIILDDVWNENRKEWLELESLLNMGQRGSRILITTRSERTATIIGNKHVYKLEGLSDEHSWNLFKATAFSQRGEEHKDNFQFIELGKKIVSKCHNFPLAIVVVGSLLYEQNISKWRSLEESGMNEIGNGNNQIMPVLKLSYHNLGSSLKRCFSYCALFPKDVKIKKELLISLWMAQGYIVPFDGRQNLEDAAEEHFWTLLQRCFFQDVEKNEYGEVESIKIHDLMHDVAQDVGKQELLCVLSSNSSTLGEKLRHVCYVGGRPPESFAFQSRIRSFICHFHGRSLLKSQITNNMMCLRVLDLHELSCEKLPDWIGKLLHLRYLNLSSNRQLVTLPSSITELHNLQTLMLDYCTQLRELPKDFGKLAKLRHLDLSSCFKLTSMPVGMEKLCNMRVLPYFAVGKGPEEQYCDGSLENLKTFVNLKDNIHIYIGRNYRRVEGMSDREARYLKSTKYLTKLKVEFSGDKGVEQEGVLEKLEPNSNLKELILEDYKGKIIPRWGTSQTNWAISFPYLVHINLTCWWLKQMPSLSKLQYLKSLKLKGLELEYMEDGTNNISQSDKDDTTTLFFPSLESLEITCMTRLKGWWRCEEDDGYNNLSTSIIIFPRLFNLKIVDCPSLTSFPSPKIVNVLEEKENSVGITAIKEVRGLKNLVINRVDHLKMFVNRQSSISEEDRDIHWKSLNQSLRSLTFEMFKDAQLPITANGAQYLTSLHTLKFDQCFNLESLPEWIGNLSSLQHLSFEGCIALKSLPDAITNLTSLQHLYIDCCKALKSLPQSMSKLTSLKSLKISFCPQLKERCQKPNGEEWTKIQHIPNIRIDFNLL